MSDISVLVTGYKRPHTLEPQITAISSQTVRPKHIVVWQNETKHSSAYLAKTNYICCKENWGVWPRFSFPLHAFDTKYVAIFDDDTIPGEQWFDNCLETIQKTPALLGANGVIFPKLDRSPRQYVGWSSCNPRAEYVDIVGHCWFFERDWLRYFCNTLRADATGDTCGEDYHFSYALQQAGIPTIVPPHPRDDIGMWGSTRGSLGMDDNALYLQPGEEEKKAAVHAEYRQLGWKLVSERNESEILP